MIRLVFLTAVGLAVVLASGCESTIDRANKIAAGGQAAFSAKGLQITHGDPSFKVLGTTVLHDANGIAVAVDLRYAGHTAITSAPILLNVLDARGASLYTNSAAGLEPSLAHLPPVAPGQSLTWINDQVIASGTPARVQVTVGAGLPVSGRPVQLPISGISLTNDPTSGAEASGVVRNTTAAPLLRLVVYATARRGAKLIAAGRAIITRLAPGKTTHFHAFFIGNPMGAQLTVSAPAVGGGR